jgi:predicted permease
MIAEIAALPGVAGVGLGTVPLTNSDLVRDVRAEGKPLGVGEAIPRGELRFANADYFPAAGIPLLRGRTFTATDRGDSVSVVIINKLVADRLFAGEDPTGKRIAWTDGIRPVYGDWYTVVGVVGNTQDGGLDAPQRGAIFLPSLTGGWIEGGIVIRAHQNVAALALPATRIIKRLMPNAFIENVRTVTDIKDRSVAPRRLNAILVSSFGTLAAIIAAIGIAGVLAFAVSARTNEIGIRMSLGADRGRVQRMILGEGGMLLAVGVALGVAGAHFGSRVMRGLLFGVAPNDPVTFITVAVVMTAIGVVACWVPALRAARIDPAITMRST